MKTVIYVPTIGSTAQSIFCDREGSFKNGLVNAAGKILIGYANREDAINETLAKLPVEPFAILHLSFSTDVQYYLTMQKWLHGIAKSAGGAPMWTLQRDGAIYLINPLRANLTMEYIPVPRQKIVLY